MGDFHRERCKTEQGNSFNDIMALSTSNQIVDSHGLFRLHLKSCDIAWIVFHWFTIGLFSKCSVLLNNISGFRTSSSGDRVLWLQGLVVESSTG